MFNKSYYVLSFRYLERNVDDRIVNWFTTIIITLMNLATDPILRRRMLTMVSEIYDKCCVPAQKAQTNNLSIAEKKAIDRCVVKYLETAKYVRTAFAEAISVLSKQNQDIMQ